jgi:uncharacterized metal-binding protein YceD (DUF177 family)
MIEAPLTKIFDLNRLSEAGTEIIIAPDADVRLRIAAWAEIVALDTLRAVITLRRLAPDHFSYAAEMDATVTQECAVTLEPVVSKIQRQFRRDLRLRRSRRSGEPRVMDFSGGELSALAGDDDVPEEIDSPQFDLAAPVLEELVLAIEPYPRAPGAMLDPSEEALHKPASPFAVLKSLKQDR